MILLEEHPPKLDDIIGEWAKSKLQPKGEILRRICEYFRQCGGLFLELFCRNHESWRACQHNLY